MSTPITIPLDSWLALQEAVATGKEEAQANGHEMAEAVWLLSGGVLFLQCHCAHPCCPWGVVARLPLQPEEEQR